MGDKRPPVSYSEQFREMFPTYLSFGMTYDQYWNDDCDLVKYYREANEIQTRRRNQDLWLQGMYIYDAILCASPVLHSFAKRGTKPNPYPTKPYLITEKERREDEEAKQKAIMEKGKRFMEALVRSGSGQPESK